MSEPIATRQWSWPREASLVHARSFGRPRAMSTVALYTASRRVESPGAVAVVTVAPGPWVVAAFGLPVVAAAGLTVLVALASLMVDGIVLPSVLFLDAVLMVVMTALVAQAFSRRWSAWRQWPGYRGEWVLSDVAAAPAGCGHGRRLLDGLTRRADDVGRALVLRVDQDNDRALALYRRSGFVAIAGTADREVRMIRRPVAP